MNLRELWPGDLFREPKQGIQTVFRSILTKANLSSGVRYTIGWRGLQNCTKEVVAWTFKIKGYTGIFATKFLNLREAETSFIGEFPIYYFPEATDPIIETYSLKAGILSQQKEYLENVRKMPENPEFFLPFQIGQFILTVDKNMQNVIVGIRGANHIKVISKDGVKYDNNGTLVQIVAPGEAEQDLEPLKILNDLFIIAATSATYSLQDLPNAMASVKVPGTYTEYSDDGLITERTDDSGIYDAIEFASYGDASLEKSLEEILDSEMPIESKLWREGEPNRPYDKSNIFKHISEQRTGELTVKDTLEVDNRPKFIILSGFLGSGKTTFLKEFIEYQVSLNQFVAVIQNEFGKVGLDGKILDSNFAVTEVEEGCVCCSLIGSTKKAVGDIIEKYNPQYIILETTGLANPYNLLDEIELLKDDVCFESITTIVDAANFKESAKVSDVVYDQIRAADVILLNKIDLVNDQQLKEAMDDIEGINNKALMIPTKNANVTPSMIYNSKPEDFDALDELINSEEGVHHEHHHPDENEHDHCGEHHHEHHHDHRLDGISSIKVDYPDKYSKEEFIEKINEIHGKILRLKGVVKFTNQDKRSLIQYVNGSLNISEFQGYNVDKSFLVFIGQRLDSEYLNSIF